MARMIEATFAGGRKIMVNADHITMATYNESEETCRISLLDYDNPITVELTWGKLKDKLL